MIIFGVTKTPDMPEDKKSKRKDYRMYARHKRQQGTTPLSRKQYDKYGNVVSREEADKYESDLKFQQKAREKTGGTQPSKGGIVQKRDPQDVSKAGGMGKQPKRQKTIQYLVGAEPREKEKFTSEIIKTTPGRKEEFHDPLKKDLTEAEKRNPYSKGQYKGHTIGVNTEGTVTKEEGKTRTIMQPKAEKVLEASDRARGLLGSKKAATTPLAKRKIVERTNIPDRDKLAKKQVEKTKKTRDKYFGGKKLVRPSGSKLREVTKYESFKPGEIGYNPLEKELAEAEARVKRESSQGKVAKAKQRGRKIIYKEKTDYEKIREENKARKQRMSDALAAQSKANKKKESRKKSYRKMRRGLS